MARSIAILAVLSMVGWQAAMAAEPAADSETLLSFHQTAETSLAPDLLTVTLRAESTGGNPAKLQQDINAITAKAVARAKAAGEITVSTGGYFVSDMIDNNGRPHEWRATQTINLSTKHFDRLLQLAGDLQQDGLLMNGMTFELSPEARQSVHERLLGEAMAAVRHEAETAAGAMNMRVLGYKTLRLGDNGRAPVFRAAMAPMMAKAAALPPTAEGAALPVAVEIDAEVRLGQP